MKAAKTWRLAGVLVLVGIATASCGKDEATGGQGGSGSVLGGSGGTAGTAGTGGGRPVGGSATIGNKLGQACVNDNACADTNTPGLTCITSKDTVLGDGAPPKGLCTAECASDEDCDAFGTGALCFPFDETASTGYCVEGCSFGDPGLGAKCHDRAEFACNPALLGATQSSCSDSEDCSEGEVCANGVCNVVFPACLPACRGDIDCDDDMYCDQSFLSGVCVTKKPTGKALGEPCTVPGPNDPAEPDECLGFCQADSATGNQGHCSATCSLGNECSYNSGSSKFDGLCLYFSALTAANGTVGDFGFCTPTCNCSDQCNDPQLVCQLLEQGPLTADFKGQGLCFGEATDGSTVEFNECVGAGGAGAGGAGAGGAGGAGGESSEGGGGAGGAPISEGGVPSVVGGAGAGG
jgi:hypothetical protein